MAIFLDTSNNPTLGIAVCDRCRFKMPIAKLKPDRNSPGLMVCDKCNDVKDPWRLPWTPADGNIALRRPRPDESLTLNVTPTVDDDGHVVDGPVPTDTTVYPSSS